MVLYYINNSTSGNLTFMFSAQVPVLNSVLLLIVLSQCLEVLVMDQNLTVLGTI